MKELKIEATVQVCDSVDELSEERAMLMQEAVKALTLSYSPYSKFKVGAAVLLNSGKVVLGANQENASYPLCLCAERSALANASSVAPKDEVKCIAITVKHEEKEIDSPTSPCGACRQVLIEKEVNQTKAIEIILRGQTGPILIIPSAKVLLPLYFDGSVL